MSKNFLIYILKIVVFWSTIPAQLACQGDKRTTRLMEIVRSADVNINFFGKVEDEKGNPVENADVELHIRKFNITSPTFSIVIPIHLKTNKYGFFSLHNEKGENVFIAKISKKNMIIDKFLAKIPPSVITKRAQK